MQLKTFLIFDGTLHKNLLKKIVKLIEEMRTSKKNNKDVAMKFWKLIVKKDQNKTKKKIKKLVMKILYYKFEHKEFPYQRAIYKVLVHTSHSFMLWGDFGGLLG
jgi:hypothetical protein